MVYEFADGVNSPYIVPVAGTIMIFGIVAVSKAQEYGTRKLQYDERMAAIAKGLPFPEPPQPLTGKKAMSLRQRNINIRLAGTLCVAGSIGIAICFALIALIVRTAEVLSVTAIATIPFLIGVGLLIDARINAKALENEGERDPLVTAGR